MSFWTCSVHVLVRLRARAPGVGRAAGQEEWPVLESPVMNTGSPCEALRGSMEKDGTLDGARGWQ